MSTHGLIRINAVLVSSAQIVILFQNLPDYAFSRSRQFIAIWEGTEMGSLSASLFKHDIKADTELDQVVFSTLAASKKAYTIGYGVTDGDGITVICTRLILKPNTRTGIVLNFLPYNISLTTNYSPGIFNSYAFDSKFMKFVTALKL